MWQSTQDSIEIIYRQTLVDDIVVWPIAALCVILLVALFIARPPKK
jgi:hypothetical protein